MTTPDQIWASGDGKNGSWTSKPSPEEWGLPQSGYIRRDPAVLAALPEVQAMIRQAMAAWQMAYDEPDRDTLDRAEADRVSAQWFAHWMRLSHPTDSENMPHYGDCTGENISCLRCIADDVLGSVDAALERAAAIREGRKDG